LFEEGKTFNTLLNPDKYPPFEVDIASLNFFKL